MTTVLRPYQLDAVTQIRQHAAAGGKGCVLQLMGGGGKTAIFCNILQGAHDKGRYGIMVVRGKKLVTQASERLEREGVPHGIYQGENTRDTHHRILLCSIDTLYARKIAPHADVAVIDECHSSFGDGYAWFFEQYKAAFKIGVSATPHDRRGMRHISPEGKLIRTAGVLDLIAGGYLVPGRYFVPYTPDLRGVAKTNGDFNAKQLGEKQIADKDLTANAAMVWDRHLRGMSAVLFAVSVEHARILQAALAERGARTALLTGNTPDDERKRVLDDLESGRLDVVASVGVLIQGVDIPSLKAVICCRPTESYNLWIQLICRASRPHPTKREFFCYDLSGNLLRHGPMESEMIADMDGMASVPKTALKHCLECYAIFPADQVGGGCCPECEAELPKRTRTAGGKRVHGLLDEDKEMVEKVVEPWEMRLPTIVARAREKGLKKGWVYHMIRGEFGEDVAAKAWPRIRAMKKWDTRRAVG